MAGPYAHSPSEPSCEWHELRDHSLEVARLASEFASAFGYGPIAHQLGLLHDLGKTNPQFQAYLLSGGDLSLRVPHAIWGASLAYALHHLRPLSKGSRDDYTWRFFALPVLGHHAGLKNYGDAATDLHSFWRDNGERVLPIMMSFLSDLGDKLLGQDGLPPKGLRGEMLLRMLFSALVDADRLDTERHMVQARTALRTAWPSLADLRERFRRLLPGFLANRTSASPAVATVRREVLEACVRSGTDSATDRLFRLTVPTGGGKTLSGLAFALEHANTHDLRRVIVAVPYTSITTQTAQSYRDLLGEDAVLEHHSALEPTADEHDDLAEEKRQLAAENWDAPLVVTTTVQLFESLFSRNPSRCRRLHNIARSVLVLDEAQTLPVELLRPIVDALRTLIEDYDVTVVLCTATQPALTEVASLPEFADMRPVEIVPQYASHFQVLRRVSYVRREVEVRWEDLAGEALTGDSRSVLLITNTRAGARRLHEELLSRAAARGEVDRIFHLSTLLCGEHRRQVLDEVRERLTSGQPTILVSTQVVEAGVDVDFHTVYRAEGPLDRIIQAAGRCNREGRNDPDDSQVIIFRPTEENPPRGSYLVATEKTKLLLREQPVNRLDEPSVLRAYFRALYAGVDTDKENVQVLRNDFRFEDVSAAFRMIEETATAVVDFQGEGRARLDDLLLRPTRAAWRRLQPYTISLQKYQVAQLADSLEEVIGASGLLMWKGGYDAELHRGIVPRPDDPVLYMA